MKKLKKIKNLLLVLGIVLSLSSCSQEDDVEITTTTVDWRLDLVRYVDQSDEYYLGLNIISDVPIDNVSFQIEVELNKSYEGFPVSGVFNQNAFSLIERGTTYGISRHSYYIISKNPIFNATSNIYFPINSDEIAIVKKTLIDGYVVIDGQRVHFNPQESKIPDA